MSTKLTSSGICPTADVPKLEAIMNCGPRSSTWSPPCCTLHEPSTSNQANMCFCRNGIVNRSELAAETMLKSTRPKTYYDTGRTTNMYTFDVVGWNNKQQHAIDLWKTQEQGLLDCMNHSKTARRRRLRSRSGYYLAIMPNGQIVGNKDTNCPHIEIDVIPHGADLVKLWAVEAELFLMIDDAGHMRGTDVDSAECIFQETFTENFFTVYYSYMYIQKRWCVGLRNKPQTRSFYRRIAKPTHDTSFVLEIVKRRFSGSSSDGSEAAST